MKLFSYLVAAVALSVAAPACAQNPPGQSGSAASGGASSSPGASSGGGTSASGGASSARGAVPVQQNQTRKQKFDQLDTNSNGMISREEAQASPELVLIFVDSDKNSDGAISAIEFQAVPLVQPDGAMVK